MIFQIVCNVVAEGYIEPEVGNKLTPELRPLLVESKSAHSWRWLFAVNADSSDEALAAFKALWIERIADWAVYYTDLEISER